MSGGLRRRVGVNLTWLVPGVVGGSEESTVAALLAVEPLLATASIDLVLFTRPALGDAHPSLVATYETVEVDAARGGKIRRIAIENTVLARATARHRIDLMHHAGGTVPLLDRQPATLTLHDLQPLDLPENFSVAKRRYLSLLLGRSARCARQIGVPSEFVRSGVIERLGADPERVHVVAWSVPPVPVLEPSAVPDVLSTYGIGERFVLYPAITYPHKNHAVLLEAFAIAARGDVSVELVLTGGAGPTEPAVLERISQPDLAGRVHRLGRVPSRYLEALYAGAAMVAFPSRYEGFGLPVLEAMVRRTPVVVSDAGSLPELVTSDMVTVGVDDIAGWADAMQSVSSQPQLRRTLATAGADAANRFTPERTAASLLDVWTQALQEMS